MEDVPDFDAIVRAYAAMVQGALRQLGVEPSALDDASQEVFLVLFRRFSDYDPGRSLASWLWGIARGVASTHRRSTQRFSRLRRAVASTDDALLPTVAQPDDAAALHEARRMLDAFLHGLDEDKCAVFVLAEIEGRSGPEIAAMLDVNVNTVYARLRAARQRFAGAVEGHRRGLARYASAWFGLRWALPGKVASASLCTAMTAALVVPALPSADVPVVQVSPASEASRVEKVEPTILAGRSQKRVVAAKVQSTTEDTTMRTPKLLPSLAVAATLATPAIAAAAPPKKGENSAPAKTDQDADEAAYLDNGEVTREYIFDGDSLEGEVLSPGGENVSGVRGIRHQSLISIRGHFMLELINLGRDV